MLRLASRDDIFRRWVFPAFGFSLFGSRLLLWGCVAMRLRGVSVDRAADVLDVVDAWTRALTQSFAWTDLLTHVWLLGS